MLVDVHCHLDHDLLMKQSDDVIKRARDAGVVRIVTSGVNPATNRECLALQAQYPDIVKCSMGVYPIDALGLSPDEPGLSSSGKFGLQDALDEIKRNKDSIVAVGEVGMDFKVAPEHEKEQRMNFETIISFVEKLKKPIVIHSRKAELACVEMLESSSIKCVIMHSFGGRKHVIRKAADLGYYFSIPPIITRLRHFQEMVGAVNINQLLTETDSPWLGPEAGKTNEPANVSFSVKKIAEIKGFDVKETEHNIYMNYQKVFE